jgi:hypothetical protein
MLNNRLRYAQESTRFPNLFLVRGDAETPDPSEVPEQLTRSHRHTYWLRYLLCSYIGQKKVNGEEVSPRELFDIFSPDENGSECFERHLVELALGSLSQVDISAMIEPRFSPGSTGHGISIRDVELTDRGKFLMESFSLHFSYLQLVIEDHSLELPDVVFNEFKYNDFDYDYLAAKESSEYGARTVEMVIYKSKLVFLFLQILESSLHFDMQRRGRTLSALQAKKFSFPGFDSVRRHIVGILSGVADTVHDKDVVLRGGDNLSSARRRRPELDEFFKKAYIDHDV